MVKTRNALIIVVHTLVLLSDHRLHIWWLLSALIVFPFFIFCCPFVWAKTIYNLTQSLVERLLCYFFCAVCPNVKSIHFIYKKRLYCILLITHNFIKTFAGLLFCACVCVCVRACVCLAGFESQRWCLFKKALLWYRNSYNHVTAHTTS